VDLRKSLPRVAQPVLLLHGDRDSIVPLAAAEYLQRALTRARLDVFSGAAHAPFVAHAAGVAKRIAEFCNER
jgi:pimeloyl-[acyl-carrier protein] methyl ester esterase